MKSIICIAFVAAIMMNGVMALPARSPSDDAEVIDVPRNPVNNNDDGFHDFKGVIDTGSNYHPFLIPEPHPFSLNLGFFDTFEDIFRSLHNRLWPLDVTGGVGDSDEDGTGLSVNVNGKKGNTTSTVKIVDGHKIEINDTIYGDDKSVFKVRVVNIRPVESDEDVGDNSDKKGTDIPSVTTSPHESAQDGSDERREPLEEKKPEDNEVKRDIDGQPEVKY